MKHFLEATDIIDYNHPDVAAQAKALAKGCRSDEEIARNCFVFVCDEIRHSGDNKDDITTCKASEVLHHKTGWCYAKSHLLAALLRANGIPTGFSYQRLGCPEYEEGIYCLHGLNSIYLQQHGWYRVDARGNKEGVNAQFDPPHECLAFKVSENEFDIPEIFLKPLEIVVKALQQNSCYAKMVANFPDIELNYI